jgi:hypothetical protein
MAGNWVRKAGWLGALAVAGVMARPPAAAATSSAGTVAIAAVTAALTAGATYLVKDYFDARRESRDLERDTEDVMDEVKRLTARADELDRENAALEDEITRARGAAAFYDRLIREDQDFLKPDRLAGKLAPYERGLTDLYIRDPALVEKIGKAMAAPEGEWQREILIRAYGGDVAGADFAELKKRLELGIAGGVVTVAGERAPRYVPGAENVKAVLEYIRGAAGPTYYKETLARLWGLTPAETEEAVAAFAAATEGGK